jgi:hypothetical protein
MNKLKLKPTYKVVKNYYTELDNLMQLSLFTEGAVSPSFAALLRYCARQFNWTLAEQFSMRAKGAGGRAIRVDGALLDPLKLVHGVWEAKESSNAAGYFHRITEAALQRHRSEYGQEIAGILNQSKYNRNTKTGRLMGYGKKLLP